MTVCVAALANRGKAIALVCDSMLSTEESSGDRIADKLRPLSDRFQWWLMISGVSTHVDPVINESIRRLLKAFGSNKHW